MKPLVSVWIITYNHEKYIAEALESVVMQKTSFDFEIVIGEDCSTDRTRSIIEEYQQKYPNLIVPVYHEINVGAMRNAYEFTLPLCKGQYIACLEGDDYWTDPLKLQKQVDFLEANEEYVMIFTNSIVKVEVGDSDTNFDRGLENINKSRSFSNVEIFNNWIVPTASVLFRNNALDDFYYKNIIKNNKFIYGDIVLFLYLYSKGKIFGLTDLTVTYRRQINGATNVKPSIEFDEKYYFHLKEIVKVFGNDLKTIKIKSIIAKLSLSLALYNYSKRNYIKSISFLFQSFSNNSNILFKYIKNKI